LHSRVLKSGGGDHRKFDRVGYMIGLVAGYVTCKNRLSCFYIMYISDKNGSITSDG
jgi:hypothetical protein